MTYIARTDIHLKPLGEMTPRWIFALDTGDLVAVAYATTRTAQNTLDCAMAAWLIDADGDAQANVDSAGIPVLVQFRHNADTAQIVALGAQGIAAALRDLLLGEPATDPPAIPWAAQLREQLSVRTAIAVARATGDLIDLTGA